ncbi:trypsin-like peptidase domain-containing protein [Dolichospermum sp. UHCC 0684]|jgi:V8-like Glu-specific endopeptidase|uniref:trypsin-like peptidase domain-containing protein n=1 Tax=unclassified Dolichospermum TaxID=2622029 RepID=UPI0014465ABA|nr:MULTISPECIES: trypsin-like peptidase domain-containing protein [unclassified Dolichospermum]MEA5530472.1 trypsin-like peptidase domain-containing protein [Dolichospermum sp. UHCC 0684]MTJ35941.1 trypsin-like peptidase domain-containing protein [Dolichospermum sp. UHCC 0260]MTJ48872.1 trypsin-like peptidase domain-containing protein [Dolichospermum sp. UHCC 0259]
MLQESQDKRFESAIARIYYKDTEQVIGAGFLVTQQHLLTCAHVVMDALGIKEEKELLNEVIELDFPFIAPGTIIKAKVVFWRGLTGKKGEDIAGLELQDTPPNSANPVQLISTLDLQNHNFEIFGFPDDYEKDGRWSFGQITKENTLGLVQMHTQNGFLVQPGYSGSGVWDTSLQAVVGMVVSKDNREDAKAVFMTPTTLLLESWSFLNLINILNANLDTATIQTAYKACYSWGNLPITVADIVKNLYDLDKNLDGKIKQFNHNDNTAQFIKYLITNSQIRQTKLEDLKKWGSDNIDNFDNLIKNVNQQYQNTDTKQESYILIKIEPLTTKSRSKIPKFKISGGVIPNIQNYIKHQTGFESIKFSDSPDDSFTLKEIEKNLFLSLFQKIPCKLEKDKKFVFFLPPQYLNHPVETWEIDDFGDRIPVRQRYPVMVRDVTRLNTNYLNVKQSNWIDKWQQLENITCNDFQKLHEYNETRFSVLMKQAIGVILNIFDENKKNDADKIIKIFSSLKSNVVPIAICHRDKITLEQQEYEIRANNELNCYIHTLPNHVLEQYEKFLLNDNDNQYLFVNNVFIIYENPHILPFKAEAIIIN